MAVQGIRMIWLYSFSITGLFLQVLSSTDQSCMDDITEEAKDYLKQFGYLSENVTPDGLARALTDFQRTARIPETGCPDNATYAAMERPRCGCPDQEPRGARTKRYVLGGSKWPKTALTYRITGYTNDMKSTDVDSTFKAAFKHWADVTSLTFTQIYSGTPDITIFFAVRNHGDRNAFDGPGKTLAHAYFPKYGGDEHYDDDERWTINSRYGTNLLSVATHEIGHTLGLSHSKVQNAVMEAFYNPYDPTKGFRLHADDIAGIQRLYGKNTDVTTPVQTTTTSTTTTDSPTTTSKSTSPTPTNPPATTSTTPTPPPTNQPASRAWCDGDGSIDAIIIHDNTLLLVFKGDSFANVKNGGIEPGYPRKISDVFDGVPDNIDAAIRSSKNGNYYFFKGKNFWIFDGSVKLGGPIAISAVFGGLPPDIDGVFDWESRRWYVFKGNMYYRLSGCDGSVERNYPRRISRYWRFGGSPDASFYYRHRFYIFDGGQYWSFKGSRLVRGYPRSTKTALFKCSSVSKRDVSAAIGQEEPEVKIKTDDEQIDASTNQRVPYGEDAIDDVNDLEKYTSSAEGTLEDEEGELYKDLDI